VAPFAAQVKTLENQLARLSTRETTRDRASARAEVAAFCERHKDQIWPYELDPKVAQAKGTATLADQLLALSDEPVAKFAEGGGAVSPRRALMALIEARPPVAKYGERLADPLTPADPAARRNQLLAHTDVGRAALSQIQAADRPAPRK
jgi:hypothetical protein